MDLRHDDNKNPYKRDNVQSMLEKNFPSLSYMLRRRLMLDDNVDMRGVLHLVDIESHLHFVSITLR